MNYVAGADEAEKVVEEIEGFGVRAYAHEADVSQEDQVVAMVARMVEEFGTIDIMVANAGLQRDAPVDEMTLAQWQKVMDVNLTGQFLCAREAAKEFVRRGVVPEVSRAAGKIICMSSVHQIIPWAGHVNYASSKGGVLMMMQTLAQELAPQRIRVNAVAPGRHPHADQPRRLGHPRGRGRPAAADSLPPRRRPGGHRQRRRRPGLRPDRLRRGHHALRGRRDDPLPRLRHRRLILRPWPVIPSGKGTHAQLHGPSAGGGRPPAQLLPARELMAFTLASHILLVPFGVALPLITLLMHHRGAAPATTPSPSCSPGAGRR